MQRWDYICTCRESEASNRAKGWALIADRSAPSDASCANSGNVASSQEIARLELLTAAELADLRPNAWTSLCNSITDSHL